MKYLSITLMFALLVLAGCATDGPLGPVEEDELASASTMTSSLDKPLPNGELPEGVIGRIDAVWMQGGDGGDGGGGDDHGDGDDHHSYDSDDVKKRGRVYFDARETLREPPGKGRFHLQVLNDDMSVHRTLRIEVNEICVNGKEGWFGGITTYDSNLHEGNRVGKYFLASFMDGGYPGSRLDEVAWKWYGNRPGGLKVTPTCKHPGLHEREIIGGDIVVHNR